MKARHNRNNLSVLFTVHQFWPEVGGSGEVVYRIAKNLVLDGYDVSVVTGKFARRNSTEVDGIKIVEFDIGGGKVKGYRGDYDEIKRYKQFLLDSNFDVSINYAAQTWTTDIFLENIEHIKSKKILVPCGLSGLVDPRYFFYFKWWMPKKLRYYDKFVFLSCCYQDKDYHKKCGLGNDVIIPNGADESEFLSPVKEDVRKKFGINTKYLAICVSNFNFLKGQDFVIRAFNKLIRDDITLVLVGRENNGSYLKLLRLMSKKNNRILILTDLDREETVDLFKSSDMFLFGSRIECSPLVMFESFASKTLFITKSVGNTPEYHEYVQLVKDPKQMAFYINSFCDGDAMLSKKVTKSFEKYKQDHTYKILYEKYKKIIEELVY